MPRPPDRGRPRGAGESGPIEPGSVLHRLLVLIAEAVARSRAPAPPSPTARAAPESPPPEDAPTPVRPTG